MRVILPQNKNPLLRARSQDVPRGEIQSLRIRKLIAEMSSLLARERYGVALAAVQLGEPIRLFIISGKALARDLDRTEKKADPTDEKTAPPDQVYINPSITKLSRGKHLRHEGCLSVRGIWGEVPRAEKATLRALDEHGKEFTRGASGFLAQIFQHEMDHLEGVIYTDKAAALYREDDKEQIASKRVKSVR